MTSKLDEKLLVAEAEKLIRGATDRGITMRLLGGLAIRIQCSNFAQSPVVRREMNDLDMITYSKFERPAVDVFKDCGYPQNREEKYVRSLLGRRIFEHPETHIGVDLFFNKLSYCHVIDLRERLEEDPLTIPIVDLFLQKAQIVQINEKDVKDMILLFHEHPVRRGDNRSIEVDRICGLLGIDWGFYHTVTTNLDKTRHYLEQLDSSKAKDFQEVLSRIAFLRQEIESCQKSLGWQMRAKIGTRRQWYNDVEELYSNE